MTVADIVEFILANRSEMAFKNWTADQLAVDLAKAINERLLSVVCDSNGNIVGVVRARSYDPITSTLYIENNLAKPGMMMESVKIALKLYPDVKYFVGKRLKNGVVKIQRYPICKFLKSTLA